MSRSSFFASSPMSRLFYVASALVAAVFSSVGAAEAAQGYGTSPSYGSEPIVSYSVPTVRGYGDTTTRRWRPLDRNYATYDDGTTEVVQVIRRVRVKPASWTYRAPRPVSHCE